MAGRKCELASVCVCTDKRKLKSPQVAADKKGAGVAIEKAVEQPAGKLPIQPTCVGVAGSVERRERI